MSDFFCPGHFNEQSVHLNVNLKKFGLSICWSKFLNNLLLMHDTRRKCFLTHDTVNENLP